MIRLQSAALAGVTVLALSALVAPAEAALPRTDKAFSCVEPDAHTSAKGARGASRDLDHRDITEAEQRTIEERTARILERKGQGNGKPLPGATIPTYVNVMVAEDRVSGDVTDQQIIDQIEVLNKTFGGGESRDAADTGFTFQLAGVERYYDDNWHNDRNSPGYRSATRRGGADALNIWLVDFPYLGIATFPWDYENQGKIDGIRVAYDSLPGGTVKNYNLGETATHEAGHWLGLFHTFQGGCAKAGDEVDDTPAQVVATNGCPEGQDSCPDLPGFDPIHNYMDYSYDSCYDQFTPGQSSRMKDMFTAYRS